MENTKKRGAFFWVMTIIVGFVAIYIAEGVALKQVRAAVLADEGIFERYVAELETPIVKDGRNRNMYCKRYRVWGLWHYKVCMRMSIFQGERRSPYDGSLIFGKCKYPYFSVDLYRVNSIFSRYESLHGRSIGLIEMDKSPCTVS